VAIDLVSVARGNVPMSRNSTLVVAAALAFAVSSGDGKPAPQKEGQDEGIQAEVRGALHFESGRGYYIAVKGEKEMRVWLWISEHKVLVRNLQGLDGKKVIAKGKLQQLSGGSKPVSRHLACT